MKLNTTINDIDIIKLPLFNERNGDLIVIQELEQVPFNIKRIFTVISNKDVVRGDHAHKDCIQFLNCPLGRIEIKCDDGENTFTYTLDNPSIGLLIPSGIWTRQIYIEENSVLNVVCDLDFNEEEYIRDYKNFKQFKLKVK
ncbi:MAG: FdtA/QdtA family cupin domain-containing protein [Flavobacteriaceae bacterium]|nr:FdtA/QdtA family cupin domain-containing protein [Flavobacteriaceae bacterium]